MAAAVVDAGALLSSILKHKDTFERDAFHILNLAPGMPHVHLETPVAEARRNYMKLAALVHPDKFTGKPELTSRATEAFQILVKVFERVANPQFRNATAAAAATKRRTGAAERATKKRTPSAQSGGKAVARSGVEPTEEDDCIAVMHAKAPPKKPSPKPSKSEVRIGQDASSSDSDDDVLSDSAWAAALAVPKRAPREVLSRNRTNDGCCRTTVRCPRCTTAWQPDDNKQYSLFMGYGLRIHCQLCLLLYGCAAAGHCCPNCAKPFDYDTSMYDDKVSCGKCKKTFGFMYYPVTGELVNKIREVEEEEEAKRRNAQEREARAKARVGGGGSKKAEPAAASSNAAVDNDALLSMIGQCVIDEQCPICHKRVASKHRSHVEGCVKNPPPPKKTRKVRKFIEEDASDSDDNVKRRRSAAPKKAPPTGKKSLASKKKTPQKRRRKNDSDSD